MREQCSATVFAFNSADVEPMYVYVEGDKRLEQSQHLGLRHWSPDPHSVLAEMGLFYYAYRMPERQLLHGKTCYANAGLQYNNLVFVTSHWVSNVSYDLRLDGFLFGSAQLLLYIHPYVVKHH